MADNFESEVLTCELIPVDNNDSNKGNIALLTINRPDKLNALNSDVHQAIKDACEWITYNKEIRVAIFTGAKPNPPPEGKRSKPHSFVAGADITGFVGKKSDEIRIEFTDNSWEAVWKLEIPTIALIDGFALGGGCELAMSCDIRISSERTKLGQPEINLGLIPGAGGTQRLTRLVGYGKAMELILSGGMIDAEEGLRIGLLNAIYSSEELFEKGLELAKEIGSKSPVTVKEAKKAVRGSLEHSLSDGIKFEAEIFAKLFDTKDKEIGVQAFINKEEAKWSGM